MNTGIGLSELLLIFILVLIFFGSKEIPDLIRKTARLLARIRVYTDKVKEEIDSIAQLPDMPQSNLTADRKIALRKQYIAIRKKLTIEERRDKSLLIYEHLKKSNYFSDSTAIMIYLNMGSEVETIDFIKDMQKNGKRIIVPFCREDETLGLTEISDPEKYLTIGLHGIPEVCPEQRKHFFRSDLHLIICPGVAFDNLGGRLGRGKSFYDRFLTDLKNHIPIIGIGFDCQIHPEQLPFDYHDIAMDQIITESGIKFTNIPDELQTQIPKVSVMR